MTAQLICPRCRKEKTDDGHVRCHSCREKARKNKQDYHAREAEKAAVKQSVEDYPGMKAEELRLVAKRAQLNPALLAEWTLRGSLLYPVMVGVAV